MKTIGSAYQDHSLCSFEHILAILQFENKIKSWNWKNKVPPTIEHSPPIGHCNSSLFLFGFMVKIDLAKLKNRDANV